MLGVRQDRLELSWDLRIPGVPRIPPAAVGFLDGLWEWDVVELFLRPAQPTPASGLAYVEMEVGAGGHWLGLAFAGVRQRARELRDLAPLVVSEAAGGRWRGRAEIPLVTIVSLVGEEPWCGLVAACLGGPGETGPAGKARACLTWPALPGAEPDFHQPQAWAPLSPRRT